MKDFASRRQLDLFTNRQFHDSLNTNAQHQWTARRFTVLVELPCFLSRRPASYR